MNAARLKLEWAILLALVLLSAFVSQVSGLTGRLDNQLLDIGTTLARPPLDKDIVLVTIDDRSIEEIGPWPWPRDVHARLIDQLSEDEAKLIVVDILFPDPSTRESDAAFADAIQRSGNVLLPHSFIARPNAVEGVEPLWPLAQLRAAAAGVGHVVATPDSDGVLRRFDLSLATDKGNYPHVGVRALSVMGQDVERHLKREGDAIVPFHPELSLIRQPAAEVLSGSTVPGLFKDKIVLVGATAQGMGDRYSVPTGSVEVMSGLGAQANLIAALRHDALFAPIGLWGQGIVALTLILGLFFAFWYLPPRYVLMCAAGVILVILLASLALLMGAHLWLAPGPIVIAAAISYPLWSWRRLSHVSRYLNREAERLKAEDPAAPPDRGMDYVTAQVDKLRGLISTVRGSLTFLQHVIEAAPDAIAVLDRNGQVNMLNERAAALFPQWHEGDAIGFDELLTASHAVQNADGTELTSADDQTFLIARAKLAQVMEGRPAGEIIALRDVTDLKKLDEERKQMLEFLSHDIRTPQAAIVGLTQQAPQNAPNSDMVARIRMQAERTLKLADDFVQLARLEQPSLMVSDSDIGALIEEACDRAYSPALAKRIVIEQHLPEDPCFANVDASLIARMLDNLIGNAIKYSDEATRVLVSLEISGESAMVITVSDEGPGLSPERQAEPFARFGAHSTHAGPSSGLGLALVKKVVDSHSGSIEVNSSPQSGTSFRITIPLN